MAAVNVDALVIAIAEQAVPIGEVCAALFAVYVALNASKWLRNALDGNGLAFEPEERPDFQTQYLEDLGRRLRAENMASPDHAYRMVVADEAHEASRADAEQSAWAEREEVEYQKFVSGSHESGAASKTDFEFQAFMAKQDALDVFRMGGSMSPYQKWALNASLEEVTAEVRAAHEDAAGGAADAVKEDRKATELSA